jgi:hypothetical protein
MSTTTESSATVTTMYVAIPDGPLRRGRVEEFADNDRAAAEQVHPGKPHRWHEMLHYGQPGTGFVHCRCGAMGIPFTRRRS